ncbi:MAG: hypothetical protein PWP51_2853 [Clostridiales bacterium]|jgi:hypothetical protein|nr:hypothetical protein [Clostridiales bacterium]
MKPVSKLEIEDKLFISTQAIEDFNFEHKGILDIHDHRLSLSEVVDSNIDDFVKYNLRYENRYLALLQHLFVLNSHPIILEGINIQALDSRKLLVILGDLDYEDKLLWLEMVKKFGDTHHDGYYLLEQVEEVNLFTKLMTRELYFPVIHFVGLGVCICGGYDISFPVFFKNNDCMVHFKAIIKPYQLFVRNAQ